MKKTLMMPIRKAFLMLALVSLSAFGVRQAKADVLAGWDMHTATGYGVSPMVASSTTSNETVGGLTRGSGVGTTNTAAARGWGGNTWTAADEASAIAANTFATFSLTPDSGYALSFTSINLDYRRSGTGPATGVLQYSFDNITFFDASTLNFTSTLSTGASLAPIVLSSISALQGVTSTVTFRIVNYGAGSANGTWYIYDVNNSTANDLVVNGNINPVTLNVSIGAGTTFSSTSFGGAAFDSADTAVFDGVAGTINLSGTVVAAGVNFTTDGYTLASPTANDAIVMASAAVNTGSATISARITGTNSLAKAGGGILVLSGSNDFVGNVNIQAGTLMFGSDSNLGDASNDIINNGTIKTTASVALASTRDISGAGSFDIAAGTKFTSSGSFNMTSVTLSNTGTLSLQGANPSLGALTFTAAGSIIAAGPISLTTLNATGVTSGTAAIVSDINFSSGNKTIDVGNGGALELDGFITLNGARIAKTGLGTLILNGSNDGGVTIGTTSGDGGTVVIGNANALGNGVTQTFHNGGTLFASTDLTGGNAIFTGDSIGGQVAAATFAGSNIEFAGVSGIFQVASQTNHIVVNNTTIFSGGFGTSGTAVGAGLSIGGTGSIVFSAPVTLNVATTVTNSATLVVNTSWTGTSASGSGLTIDVGATIKGGGTIIGGLTVNGTLSPGNSPGLLTVDNLTLGSTATTVMELAGNSTRGTDYDAIDVTNLTLDGVIKVVLDPSYDPVLGTSFNLFDWTGTLVDNGVTFDFSGAVLDTGLGWDTSNFSTDGTISIVAIPEPSTTALLLGGVLGLTLWGKARLRSEIVS